MFHYHCRADRSGHLWTGAYADLSFQQHAGGCLLRNSPGSCRYVILLSSGLFSLYGRNPERSGKIYSSNAGHAGMLVHYPGDLYYRNGTADPGHPGDFLGLSLNLDFKLHCIFNLFSEIRLDPFLRKSQKPYIKRSCGVNHTSGIFIHFMRICRA